jgi:hypothetical protein
VNLEASDRVAWPRSAHAGNRLSSGLDRAGRPGRRQALSTTRCTVELSLRLRAVRRSAAAAHRGESCGEPLRLQARLPPPPQRREQRTEPWTQPPHRATLFDRQRRVPEVDLQGGRRGNGSSASQQRPLASSYACQQRRCRARVGCKNLGQARRFRFRASSSAAQPIHRTTWVADRSTCDFTPLPDATTPSGPTPFRPAAPTLRERRRLAGRS